MHMEFDSTALNQVYNIGNCFVTGYKRIKRLERRPKIRKHIVLTEISPKSIRYRLSDLVDLDGENGRIIGSRN